MKDNSTGKDKEFYDLGKKMFDHMQVIKAKTQGVERMKSREDEEWELLERKLKNLTKLAEEVKTLAERPPVAWRKRVNGVWHYFDESSPFPPDGCEPLYLRSEK